MTTVRCDLKTPHLLNFPSIALESHASEKRQLVNEIVSLKKRSDLHERDCARRDLQVNQYKSEADKGLAAIQDAERKVQNYRVEVL